MNHSIRRPNFSSILLKNKLKIETDYISKIAKDKLEKVGCTITLKEKN